MAEEQISDEILFENRSLNEDAEGSCIISPSVLTKLSAAAEKDRLRPRSRFLGRTRCSTFRGEGSGTSAPGRVRSARLRSGRVFSARARVAPSTPRSGTRTETTGRQVAAGGDAVWPSVAQWRQRSHLRNMERDHLEDLFTRYTEENTQLEQERQRLQQELRTVGARYLYLRLQALSSVPPQGPQAPREAQQLQEAQKQRLRALYAEQQALRRRAQALALQLRLQGRFTDNVRAIRVTHPIPALNSDEDEYVEPLTIQQLELERLRAQINERRHELWQLRRGLVNDRRALLALREQVRFKRRALAADVRAIRWRRAQLTRGRTRTRSPSPADLDATYSISIDPATYTISLNAHDTYDDLAPTINSDPDTAIIPQSASERNLIPRTFSLPGTTYDSTEAFVSGIDSDSDTISNPPIASDIDLKPTKVSNIVGDSCNDLASTIDSDPDTVVVPASSSESDTALKPLDCLNPGRESESPIASFRCDRNRALIATFPSHSAPATRSDSTPCTRSFVDAFQDQPSEGMSKNISWKDVIRGN